MADNALGVCGRTLLVFINLLYLVSPYQHCTLMLSALIVFVGCVYNPNWFGCISSC